MISVVIPTIKGREHWLARCIRAYRVTTPGTVQYIIERDHPHCGAAWAAGGALARGEYLHFTADDIEPLPGWAEAAMACTDKGYLPCARVLSTDGSLQSCGAWGQEMAEGTPTDIARVPFMSRAMWGLGGWILPCHYYTDNWIAMRGIELGIPTVVCRDFLVTHHFAMEGRFDNEAFTRDRVVFERWFVGDKR